MSAAPLRVQRAPSPPLGAAAPQRAPGSPRRAPTLEPQRHLRAVAAPPRARSIVPFAWLCVTIVIGAMAAVLLLNTAMARGAYEARDLRIEIADLHEQRATLLTTLEASSAPDDLAESAAALGMVPASTIGFVSIEDETVLNAGGR